MTNQSPNTPVVMVHGMWSTPETLDELKHMFEDSGYPVHVPRLPHHYPRRDMTESAKASLATATVNEYVDSLVRFINSLDRPPILLGHSMGGLLVQLVANRVKLEKLIIISSAAPSGIPVVSLSVFRTLGRNLLKFPLWKSTTNLLLRNIQYGIANVQSAELHKDIIKNSTFESGNVTFQIAAWFLFRKPPTKVEYQAIDCPILIVGGTEDRITPISIQRKLFRLYKGKAVLNEIKGCDHWTIGGKYLPEIRESIIGWLNSTPQSRTEEIVKTDKAIAA